LGLTVEQQKPIHVYFHGKVIGDYFADMIVDGVVLLELKSAEKIIAAYEAQMLNYLKATRIEVGLLLNFGPQAEFRRKIYDNSRKGSLSWTKNP
jgi:GxxExxY protein